MLFWGAGGYGGLQADFKGWSWGGPPQLRHGGRPSDPYIPFVSHLLTDKFRFVS